MAISHDPTQSASVLSCAWPAVQYVLMGLGSVTAVFLVKPSTWRDPPPDTKSAPNPYAPFTQQPKPEAKGAEQLEEHDEVLVAERPRPVPAERPFEEPGWARVVAVGQDNEPGLEITTSKGVAWAPLTTEELRQGAKEMIEVAEMHEPGGPLYVPDTPGLDRREKNYRPKKD